MTRRSYGLTRVRAHACAKSRDRRVFRSPHSKIEAHSHKNTLLV
jgi:hypothetical protein